MAMCHQSSSVMPTGSCICHSCLLASGGGDEKQAGSLSSQPHTPVLLSSEPTSVTWAVSASFPPSLFPAAEFKPVSNLDEDHLFKSTKHNLEYMEYGQHI